MINRKTVICVIAGLLSSAPTYADEHKKGSQPSKDTLRNYCILPEDCVKVDPPRDMPDCGIRPLQPPKHPCLKEVWLKRPGSKCCVAIARFELDGNVVLNPSGFAYGPIPSLRHMTQSEADELWRSDNGKSVAHDITSYRLLSYGAPNPTYIDLVFQDDKIRKYRIRTGVSSSSWSVVYRKTDKHAEIGFHRPV